MGMGSFIFASRVTASTSSSSSLISPSQDWAEEMGMGSFISVSRGSSEPLRFLEIHYKGADEEAGLPIAFVGKGVTFDTGKVGLRFAFRQKLGGVKDPRTVTIVVYEHECLARN